MRYFLFIIIAAMSFGPGQSQELSSTQRLWKNSFSAERSGNYKSALEYAAAIRNESESYLINLRSGWLHYLLKNYDEAIAFYSKASVMAPGAVTPLMGLSNSYQGKNDIENAIRVTGAVLALDPTNYVANNRLAELFWNRKDYARAASYYLKLSMLYPEDLDLGSALGWCYLKQGRAYEAKVIFKNILIVNPEHAGARDGMKLTQPKPKRPELEKD